jgi:eukaryotic-like serine/threonine-protein kinase
LKIEGITRNQSIRDFDQKDQTVADILTALVRKANPVTTVKDPSEKDQKLVWVIGPDPEGGKEVVLITTRAAAGAKKYVLPGVFGGKGK